MSEWTESACSVNVYLEEQENYFIPTPIDEIEDLDYNFGDIEIAKDQPDHIKIFSLLHEAGHAMDYINYVMGQREELSTIDKELSAWAAGEEIAKKVNFILDKDDWTGYKDICIKLYMEE